MSYSEKRSLRQIDLDAMKCSGSQRLHHDQIGNSGSTVAGFHSNTHGFVRWQLKPDIEVGQFYVKFLERGLEHGSGAGAGLTQNPACLRQKLWCNAHLAGPRMACS